MEHYKEIIKMIEMIQKAELEKSLNAFLSQDTISARRHSDIACGIAKALGAVEYIAEKNINK